MGAPAGGQGCRVPVEAVGGGPGAVGEGRGEERGRRSHPAPPGPETSPHHRPS